MKLRNNTCWKFITIFITWFNMKTSSLKMKLTTSFTMKPQSNTFWRRNLIRKQNQFQTHSMLRMVSLNNKSTKSNNNSETTELSLNIQNLDASLLMKFSHRTSHFRSLLLFSMLSTHLQHTLCSTLHSYYSMKLLMFFQNGTVWSKHVN